MRRFSQRNQLVTVSEINITPLLDLAFVLLIIFIITTPLLEQSISMKLPKGAGQPDQRIDKHDIRTVEISNTGVYALDRQRMNLNEVLNRLASDYRENPNLIVYIRGDKDSRWDLEAQLFGGLERLNITRVSIRTEPPK
jgi:biopolymer transport protein ExbD